MKKGAKRGFIIGGVVLLAGSAAALAWYISKNRKDDYQGGKKEDEDSTPDVDNNGGGGGTTAPAPFTNKADGDKFRGWVNDKYPDYAKSIDLDRSGSYDNAYIKKAWDKYGVEYKLESAAWGASFNAVKSAVSALPSGFTKQITSTYVKVTKDANTLWLFNNGRAILKKGSVDVWRGVYYNGGNKLVITDGFNKGRTFNGTLYENLVNSLKLNFRNFAIASSSSNFAAIK